MKFHKLLSLFFIFPLIQFGLSCGVSLHAQEISDSTKYYQKILVTPSNNSEIASAFAYLDKLYKINLQDKDTLTAVRNLRFISYAQVELGALHEGEETVTKALKLLENQKENPIILEAKRSLYNELGMIYRMLKNYRNAFGFYNEGLKYCETAIDSMAFIINKGNLYHELENYSLAEKRFRAAYKISLQSNDTINQARTLQNIGWAQSKQGNPEAIKNLEKALSMRQLKNDLYGLYASYSNLAKYHHERSDQDKAVDYALKAHQVANKINSPSYMENSLRNLLEIRGDSISKKYIKLKDSLEQAKLQKQNKYAGMQYNVAQEKKEKERIRILQEREKRKKQGFQFLGIILFMGIGAIYFIQRSRNKKNTLKQIYNTEDRISKKVHDEVANDVYTIMTKIQINFPEADSLLDNLDDIYIRTRDISRDNSAIILRDDFGAQLKELLRTYEKEGLIITLQNITRTNFKVLSEEKKIVIYRVLQEMMTNMKKHSKATHVLVSFEMKGKKLKITYSDNGVGSNLQNKNGLENMENRIKAVNGSINFETSPQNGFKITITL